MRKSLRCRRFGSKVSPIRCTIIAIRNRRWLDAVIDAILARDLAWVRQQLAAVQSAPDLARRAVVQGLMLGVEKRWLDAWATYTSVSETVLDQADSVVRYRLLVLTAWSMICAGRDLDALDLLLTRAKKSQDAIGP